MVVSTLSPSGGSLRDTVQKIKFNPPRSFQVQNTQVTLNDYIRILQRDYASSQLLQPWGGEDNDPPVYGKVYLSKTGGLTLSEGSQRRLSRIQY